MTAAEIHNLVKDVAPEDWPDGLSWDADTSSFYNTYTFKYLGDSIVESAWLGHLIAWLVDATANEDEDKCRDSVTIFANWIENEVNGYLVSINGFGNCTHLHQPGESWHAPTRLGAVVAAYKAVKERESK